MQQQPHTKLNNC